MEPNSKKRKLLAKTENASEEQMPYQQRFDSGYPAALMGDDLALQTSPSNHADFERFAKDLQDAASRGFAQTQPTEERLQYSSVTVLLLRWEDDVGVDNDLQALEKLFRERYNYKTQAYTIPSIPDPIVKLSLQIAKQLDQATPESLLILYYAGFAFTGGDDNLYWACNAGDDSPRLKWEGIKSLIEDAQSDILLLLDACAVPDSLTTGSNGTKEGIAAYGPDSGLQDHNGPTFTYNLIDALHNLGTGVPFTVQRLQEELGALRHQRSLDNSSITNGNGDAGSLTERIPVTFSLIPMDSHIAIAPLAHGDTDTTFVDLDDAQSNTVNENAFLNGAPSELVFDELRALVSLSFMGEASQEMEHFKSWLDSTPASGAKVTIEGMFQGPPTIIILSLPAAVWNVIQADRVCSFLGYVKSHNMFRQHQALSDFPTASGASKHLEDGKILLEAREAAVTSPSLTRQSPHHQPASMVYPPVPQTANMVDHTVSPGPRKDDVEDSDEMHEAAIQLKALSHVRPPGHDDSHGRRSVSQLHDDLSFNGADGVQATSGLLDSSETPYPLGFNTPSSSRTKGRRTNQKAGPKQDTRCSMCSHTPFKDSSSLRKHVAAAHTRPFPCAFSFAGCTSTFGSKNEWKRHIASQHLCLTFYRCSSCPQTTIEGKGNEFNRKDLFTQHLRRMHAPFAIKKALTKGDSKLQMEWENHVKEMQASCLVVRRHPPQRSACPKPDCSNVFEGAGSWDDWTEHVGRHMEKGEAGRLGVDKLLARWALEEGIIERREDGEYRLCGQDRESQPAGYYSDNAPRNPIDDSLQDHSMIDHALDNMLEDGVSQGKDSANLPDRKDSQMYSMWS